jgi:hypothetical protein
MSFEELIRGMVDADLDRLQRARYLDAYSGV